jgi:hypothetical protein
VARSERGLVGKALTRLEETTGQTIVSADRLDHLEEAYTDYRMLRRETEELGWSVLNYAGGEPSEMRLQERRRVVQRARYVWMNDPQAGAAVELMNDFVFGRGVPRPVCKDKKVQEVVDEAWDDPDNQEVLTSLEAQLALGTDLALQSNLFLLMFDQGADGKVKLSILRHDDVTDAIPDEDKRHRLLWYTVGRPIKRKYDFKLDQWQVEQVPVDVKPLYYEHWRNVELARDEKGRDTPLEEPEKEQLGEGKVYHVRINRYSEQKFGTPRFQRTLRWYTAYNDFVKARIDVAQAKAAYVMKRRVKGTPNQLARDAAKLISRSSGLAGADPNAPYQPPPKPGSVLVENESVVHEALNLGQAGGQAQEDANVIRAPIAAAERFTQAYFGDASQSNLATATSLELPILKAVETRQEVFEAMYRWFVDRVIEKAVDDGRISNQLEPDEVETPQGPQEIAPPEQLAAALQEAVSLEAADGRQVIDAARLVSPGGREMWVLVTTDGERTAYRLVEAPLVEAHEDKPQDEASTERDLGYEFSMPSPLRRMMSDLVSAVVSIAQTFDPNNTNPELSRALLTVVLGEGLEVQDPADLVDQVLPKGRIDPLLQMQMEAAKAAQAGPVGFGVAPAGEEQMPTGADANAYGAPMNSPPPERRRGSGPYGAQEAEFHYADRRGMPVAVAFRHRLEEHFDDMPEPVRRRAEGRRREASEEFGRSVIDLAMDELDAERIAPGSSNGKEG